MEYRRICLIRVGDDRTLNFAAEELAKYLSMTSTDILMDKMAVMGTLVWKNSDLSAVKELAATKRAIILRTSGALAEQLKVARAELDDGYRINITNDTGLIEGTNPRSVLLGVYRFLKELGYAFVRPGKGGERIPETLPVEYAVNIEEKASFRHRGITLEGADSYRFLADMVDYLPKCGMNEYFVQYVNPYLFLDRWYGHRDNPELAAEPFDHADCQAVIAALEEQVALRGLGYQKVGHGWTCEPFGVDTSTRNLTDMSGLPEKFREKLALVDGKRELYMMNVNATHLCYTDPEVRDIMLGAIVDFAKANPQVDTVHFWLADAPNNHCECPECQKQSVPDIYVGLLNELDERLTAAGVATKIVFLLYFDLLWKPETATIKNPDRFILMFAPISRFYGQNYSDSPSFEGTVPPFVRNQNKLPENLSENLALLKGWQEMFKGDSFIFDYHLQWAYLADPGCALSAKNVFDDMAYLDRIGLNGSVSCQIQRCHFPSGLAVWSMGEALWNNSQSFESVKARYYRASFGEKGAQVEKYLDDISALFTVYPYYKQRKNGGLGTPHPTELPYVYFDRVEDVLNAFLPVIEEGIANDAARRKDWEALKFHQDYVRKLAAVLHETDLCNDEARDAAIEEMVTFVRRNEVSFRDFLDGQNTVNRVKDHFQGSF